ncbi:MAG: hypothetical protein K2Y37_14715 [Pirellulales bacterium]|nr:hypothetical protein [Pirellulales bacterium]
MEAAPLRPSEVVAQELRRTLRTAKLSENVVNVALACWRACQAAPDRVGRIVVGDLADDFQKPPRSLRRWLDQLATAGIVQIRSHNTAAGVYRVVMTRASNPAPIDLAPPPPADEAQTSLDFGDHTGEEAAPAVLAFPCADQMTARSEKPASCAVIPSADEMTADKRTAHREPASQRPGNFSESQRAEYKSVIADALAAVKKTPASGARLATRAKDLRPKDLIETKDLDLRPRPKDLEPSGPPPPEGVLVADAAPPGRRRPDGTSEASEPDQPASLATILATANAAGTERAALERRRALVAEIARDLAAGPALAPAFWENLASLLDQPDADGRRRFDRRELLRLLAYALKTAPREPARRAKLFSAGAIRRARECGLTWPRGP